MTTENSKSEMISLYQYLGKAAGPELGSKVYNYANSKKIPVQTRFVETKTYVGKVMLYPKVFLQEYFKNKI